MKSWQTPARCFKTASSGIELWVDPGRVPELARFSCSRASPIGASPGKNPIHRGNSCRNGRRGLQVVKDVSQSRGKELPRFGDGDVECAGRWRGFFRAYLTRLMIERRSCRSVIE